jgi:hypothetical protein
VFCAVSAFDPLRTLPDRGNLEAMNEIPWDERLKKVAKARPAPDKPE